MCSFTKACVLPQDTRPVMVDGKPLYDEQGELVEEVFCPIHENLVSIFRKQPFGDEEEQQPNLLEPLRTPHGAGEENGGVEYVHYDSDRDTDPGDYKQSAPALTMG